MSTPLPHCRRCNQPVPTGRLVQGYGRACAARYGLRPPRKARTRRPERTGVEQPSLFDLGGEIEINDESEEPMNYIQDAIAAVDAELPDLDPELARLYALLALTTGETTTWEDVHNAWSIWQDRTKPDHRSIIPFDELAETTQELDAPYAEGIHRAVRKLEAGRG